MERPSVEEVAATILRHARMMIAYKGEYTGMHEIRKHAAWYTTGYPNSSQFRRQINEVETYAELEKLLTQLI
jgi:tRNA-dihydrouridine synthase